MATFVITRGYTLFSDPNLCHGASRYESNPDGVVAATLADLTSGFFFPSGGLVTKKGLELQEKSL